MEKYLSRMRSELDRAARAFYAHLAINKEAVGNVAVYHALDRNALTWNAINDALATELYVVLGRIFDTGKKSFGLFRFIDICRHNVDQFSLEKLRERKMKGSDNYHEWIDEYMATACAPTVSDFDSLCEEALRVYALLVQPCKIMRNKLVAHADEGSVFGESKLEGPLIDDIRRMLGSVYGIYNVAWQFYYNGRKSSVRDYKYDEERYVNEDVTGLVAALIT